MANMSNKNNNSYISKATNFLAAFFVIFGLSFAVVSFVQAVLGSDVKSSSKINQANEESIAEATNIKEEFELPTRIIISKIAVDQPILNPISTDPDILDENLLNGVVRYPGSGLLKESRNMFIFGHSTGFRVVQNQAFKAFNRLGELAKGDEIVVMSGSEAHIYRVISSKQVSANDALVEFNTGNTLTLVTCNTFGRKEDRFQVDAEFIRSYKLTD
jgi:LPXTG-site transpeptidase (sortase) family protein